MIDEGRYNEAVLAVFELGYASVSALQRELQTGYIAALRLLDRMEADGIVGPLTTTGRKILITKDQWLSKAGR